MVEIRNLVDAAHMQVEDTVSAPWWGVSVIAGGFLVVGAALALLSTYLSDRRRARHELERLALTESTKRQQDMRAAAASFLVETRNVFEAFKSNFVVDEAGVANKVAGQPISLERADQAYWTLVFVAPDDVEEVAYELYSATRLFRRYIRGTYDLEPFSEEEWHNARDTYFLTRKAFITSIKASDEVGRHFH